ncbi:hypothetical protein HAX54_017624 [Datura stramonium]|uniref:Uncharacterized protein n=1 Tax=Datura stramonium TaxID=4076 RepID=A0ABS8UL78_DATST|nr:hypothetical protein [Datura stramonium]
MARKWQKFAAKQREENFFPRSNYDDAESCSTSSSVVENICGLYRIRSAICGSFGFQHEIIRQLLHMSEEEFGSSQVMVLSHYHAMLYSWTTSYHSSEEV